MPRCLKYTNVCIDDGEEKPLSQFCIVLLLTPIAFAACAWLNPAACRADEYILANLSAISIRFKQTSFHYAIDVKQSAFWILIDDSVILRSVGPISHGMAQNI